jgi:hypothetical protein
LNRAFDRLLKGKVVAPLAGFSYFQRIKNPPPTISSTGKTKTGERFANHLLNKEYRGGGF